MRILQTKYLILGFCFFFLSKFSSEALVHCTESFVDNVYQDLIFKKMCSFFIKGKLHVGAGLPRHISILLFKHDFSLKVLKHQNSSKQKQKISVKTIGRGIRALGRKKDTKTFVSHL